MVYLLCLDHVEVDCFVGVKDPDVANVLFATRGVVTRLDVDAGVVRSLVNPEHTVELVVIVGQFLDSFTDHGEVGARNTLGVEVFDEQLLEAAFANTFLYAVLVRLLELGDVLADVVEVDGVNLVGVDGTGGRDSRDSSHIC